MWETPSHNSAVGTRTPLTTYLGLQASLRRSSPGMLYVMDSYSGQLYLSKYLLCSLFFIQAVDLYELSVLIVCLHICKYMHAG